MNRVLALVLVVVGWSWCVGAATVPDRMSYEGKLSTAAGVPVSGTRTLSFALYAAASGGSPVWSETQDVNVQNGVFSVILGQVNTLATAFQNTDQRWLGVTASGDSEMQPRQRITSVGYALNADTLDGQHAPSGTLVGTTDVQTLSSKTLVSPAMQGAWDGWVLANETWTCATGNTFTVSGDVTGKYQRGDRLRLKQGGAYKYFSLIALSYSSPNTTLTITAGNDFSLASGTITDNYYSKIESPQGFPEFFNYTPSMGTFTLGNGSMLSHFFVERGCCTFIIRLRMGSTSSVTTGAQLNFGSAPLVSRSTESGVAMYPATVTMHYMGANAFAGGVGIWAGTSSFTQILTGNGVCSDTSPMPWNTHYCGSTCNNEIAVSGTYEYQ